MVSRFSWITDLAPNNGSNEIGLWVVMGGSSFGTTLVVVVVDVGVVVDAVVGVVVVVVASVNT